MNLSMPARYDCGVRIDHHFTFGIAADTGDFLCQLNAFRLTRARVSEIYKRRPALWRLRLRLLLYWRRRLWRGPLLVFRWDRGRGRGRRGDPTATSPSV